MEYHKGRWASLSSLQIARSHGAVVTFQNQLYVFGGGGPAFKSLNSVVVYDPKSDTWQSRADMPTARSGTAGFLINEKIYIIGGGFKKPDGNFQFLTTVEIYDPVADRWETGPSMLQPHDYPAATRIDNDIYILGGHHPDACLGGPKTDPGFNFCEKLAGDHRAWQEIAAQPTPRFASAAITINNTLWNSGGVAFTPEGFNNFDFFEVYSPITNAWQRAELTLPWPAAGHGLCAIDNNIFFFGGYSTDNIHHRAACLSLTKKEWLRLPDMPCPRAAMGLGIIDNTIYLVGGWADDGRTPLASIITYTY